MLPLRARVDMGAMATKGCSAFPQTPALLEPHNQSSRCILQPQPAEQKLRRGN